MEVRQESCFLGIELGSTRIKAVLIDPGYVPVASGSFLWADSFQDGYWTYSLEDVWKRLQACFADLKNDFFARTGQKLRKVRAIGVSGMMHGFLAFDSEGRQLASFRTWKNTTADEASLRLSELFDFNIPQRWSISHLYQDVLDKKPYVGMIAQMTTLSGYVHFCLTGKKVLGSGDASGMFPVNESGNGYDETMAEKFLSLAGIDIRKIFPQVLLAGEDAGTLTKEGALLLDPSGELECGIPFAPPEGDAGTGMTATNSTKPGTGNVSAGTSIFAMVVSDKPLSKAYREIDLVTTPDGKPVAMVHCNNCTSDMNEWVRLFRQVAELTGGDSDLDRLYGALYEKSLSGSADCGGLTVFNYVSGEPVTGFNEGCPVIVRQSDAELNLADFVRAHLYSAFASLAYGMRILTGEHVRIDRLMGHGGIFRHCGAGQRYLSAAVSAPVFTMKTAGEGGPYGMALLAAFCMDGKGRSLSDFLEEDVFSAAEVSMVLADQDETAGFRTYLDRFLRLRPVEKAASELV